MNMLSMEKMLMPLMKSALKDPKKRAYVEKTLTSMADTATLQNYVNMSLYGIVFQDGKKVELDEEGDIPKLLQKLDEISSKQDEILSLLKKVVGEK